MAPGMSRAAPSRCNPSSRATFRTATTSGSRPRQPTGPPVRWPSPRNSPAGLSLDGFSWRLCDFARAAFLGKESVSPFEHRNQKTNLGIDFRRVCYGLRDFFPEKDPIAFAKTVDRHFQPPFGGAHFARELGVGNFGLTEKENLELLEIIQAAVLGELVPEARDGPVEQHDGPAAFEDMFRRGVVQRFEPVPFLAGSDFKRQNGPS